MTGRTRRFRTTLAVSAAAAMAISLAGVPATTAQPTQSLIPGSSFDFVVDIPGDTGEPSAPSDPIDDEFLAELVDATNAAREANYRAPLRHNAELSRVATEWSQVQADEGRMFHNPNVADEIPSGWRHWGENVLQNWERATPEQLVDQWMNSRDHRLNILRTGHTDFGVGMAVADDGRLYATQVFARY